VEISDARISSTNATPARNPRPALIPELILLRFKKLLSESWSPETAYPGAVDQLNWTPGNPCGQCGVSSVWLAEVLRCQYSVSSTFCLGSLTFYYRGAENLLDDHCWLEINEESGDELILDLTCDQARGFDRPIVFNSKTDLDQERIYYLSRERVDISNLHKNPVWPRYRTLLVNLRQLASDNHMSQKGPDRSRQFGDETLELAGLCDGHHGESGAGDGSQA
jgi:hypothetical protein